MNQKRQISCGLESPYVPNLEDSLKMIQKIGYNFIIVPLTHPRYKREFIAGSCYKRKDKLTRSDMTLVGSEWTKLVIGKLSPYINVDSEIADIRKNSEATLKQELGLAAHLSLQVVMTSLHSVKCCRLGRVINSTLSKGATYHIWVRAPITHSISPYRADVTPPTEEDDPWEWWNQLRSYCNYRKQVRLALELSNVIPTEAEVDRWLGEPVQCLIIPTSVFLTNQHGYPVIARAMQLVIRRFLMLDVQFIITGRARHQDNLKLYHSYILHLSEQGPLSNKYIGYEDFLQFPLQPLADNLEAQVYEVFEKDPIKYNKYQDAVVKALQDRVPEEKRNSTTQTVMILGAGRGPLVQAVINAGELTKIVLKIYAVEKNSYAINTLYALNEDLWDNKVTIVDSDMRHCNPDDKADILVSELLGSFGDNELSPECLDGAQHLLKNDGISIPCAYTSWLAPMHSPKMLNEIKAGQPVDKTLLYCFETLYVVHLVNQYQIAPAQACWTFHHPNKSKPLDNSREVTLRFQAQQNCILNGFVGYFDTELYKGIMLSTEPRTYSEGMISWFPIFFPLQDAVQIKADDIIEVTVWRCVNERNVWYEWCVNKPVPQRIYNANGQSYTISL